MLFRTPRVTTHGLRRTFNNEVRREAGEIVARSITGHVTQAMTEHYSHVDRAEKLAAVSSIARRMSGLDGEFGGGNGVSSRQAPD